MSQIFIFRFARAYLPLWCCKNELAGATGFTQEAQKWLAPGGARISKAGEAAMILAVRQQYCTEELWGQAAAIDCRNKAGIITTSSSTQNGNK